ncbi:MAG: hypothetical protein HOV70_31000 [Streptomyces sp.]|nr:hypothetical protein [Streptomyces sp.]NUS31367.1 hypothetical protein [Streptomyces sp.]NUS80611.1 hypothetical protein [Streptomyces sp.]
MAGRVEENPDVVLRLNFATVVPRAVAESRSSTWKSTCVIGRDSPSTGGHTGGVMVSGRQWTARHPM